MTVLADRLAEESDDDLGRSLGRVFDHLDVRFGHPPIMARFGGGSAGYTVRS